LSPQEFAGEASAPELWCVDLSAASDALHTLESRTVRLAEQDRQTASSMSDQGAAREWLATHIALRLLLERAVGARWRGVPLTRKSGVRPYLEGASIAFSLSHVDGVALIALAHGGDIGVDVERARRVRVREPRRGLIAAAGAQLNAGQPLPAKDGDDHFLQAWVRLEAFAKAQGCGIGRLLTQLGIVGGRDVAAGDLKDAVEAARAGARARVVHDLDLGREGLFAAVALPPAQSVPDVRWLPASVAGLAALIA
jgi:4'-phosphopantetheinyl transferase